jgi:lysophospholipase
MNNDINLSEKNFSLPDRNQQPPHWRWHNFKNAQGRSIRFGTVSPKDTVPDAVVVALPGLSEFGEKYFELAHDMLDRNMAFWVIDWCGQGASERYIKSSRHKRHSESFQNDLADLHQFISGYVRHAAVHPDVGRIPLVMLAHSMGGNIGLTYLSKYPDIFSCAAFSAPMLGIADLDKYPSWVLGPLTSLLALIAGKKYVFGGGDWSQDNRTDPTENEFSSDPVRSQIHNYWSIQKPELQIGSPTFNWLRQAYKAIQFLQKPENIAKIELPVLCAVASNDRIVSNSMITETIKKLPHHELIIIDKAKHEIFMEKDEYRLQFLKAFDKFLKTNNIRNKLAKF